MIWHERDRELRLRAPRSVPRKGNCAGRCRRREETARIAEVVRPKMQSTVETSDETDNETNNDRAPASLTSFKSLR